MEEKTAQPTSSTDKLFGSLGPMGEEVIGQIEKARRNCDPLETTGAGVCAASTVPAYCAWALGLVPLTIICELKWALTLGG